jgi:hypothetical protein
LNAKYQATSEPRKPTADPIKYTQYGVYIGPKMTTQIRNDMIVDIMNEQKNFKRLFIRFGVPMTRKTTSQSKKVVTQITR